MLLVKCTTAKEGFTIDRKETRYYSKIAKPYSKTRQLRDHWDANPSLKIFVENLERRFQRLFPPKDES